MNIEQNTNKPDCPLIGADSNIFNLAGIAASTLKHNGQKKESDEMWERIKASGSYESALMVIADYVNIVAVEELEFDMDEEELFDMEME